MMRTNPCCRWDDEELVAGVLKGQPGCFDELHDRYRPRVYRFALRRTGDPCDAEDVTQEVFLEVHRSLRSYRGHSKLATWLFGIAHYRILRLARRRGPTRVPLDAPELRRVAVAEPAADRRADAVRVLRRCGELLESEITPTAREAFELRYLAQRSIRQLAEGAGASPNAVKCSLRRTRRTLSVHTRELRASLS